MEKISTLIIRDWTLPCFIGVVAREKQAKQAVLINMVLEVSYDPALIADDIEQAVCYEKLKNDIAVALARQHIQLVETAAQLITDIVYTRPAVVAAKIRVEKPEVFPDDVAVGFELITRRDGR